MKNVTGSIQILLVEDNQVTSQTLVVFLSSVGYQVKCASNGRSAIQFFNEQSFDLVILDLMLPDIGGLHVCTTIRSQSDIPIIMLTAKTTEDEIVVGLESGADDYVCKPFGAKELLARVRRCLRKSIASSIPDKTLSVGKIEMEIEQRMVRVSGECVKLTKSEFEILFVLIRQPGRVFTRDQLIKKALGQNYDGFDRSIDTHVWSLRKKIGEPRGNPEYILSEPGIGYRMSDKHGI